MFISTYIVPFITLDSGKTAVKKTDIVCPLRIYVSIEEMETAGKSGLLSYYNRNSEFSLCLTPNFCNLVKPLDLFFEYYY